MQNDNKNPLVSVLIISYNSALYIAETLDSVYRQTYANIELIISDDGSKDSTIDIVSQWLLSHNSRFVNTCLLTTKVNTGTAANCNRALAASKGEWLKFFGADDVLMDDAISNYVNYVSTNDVNAVIAEAVHFSGPLLAKQFTYESIALEKVAFSDSITPSQQYKILSKVFIGSGPTFFVSRKAIVSSGAFDERYPLQEDYPLFIRLVKNRYKIWLYNQATVFKRVRNDSVSHEINSGELYGSITRRCICEYKYEFRKNELKGIWRLFHYFSLWLHMNVFRRGNDRGSIVCRFYYGIQKILDPFDWYLRYLNIKDKLL